MKDFERWKEVFLQNDSSQVLSHSSASFSIVFYYASAFNVMSKIPFDEMNNFLSTAFSRAINQIEEASLQNETNTEIQILKELGEKYSNMKHFVWDLDHTEWSDSTIIDLYSYMMKMKWFYMNSKRICLSVAKQTNRIAVCQIIVEMFLRETCLSTTFSTVQEKCQELLFITRYALFKHLTDSDKQIPIRKLSEESYQEIMSILEFIQMRNFSIIHQMFLLIISDSEDLSAKSLCTQFSRFKSTLPFENKCWFSQDYNDFQRISQQQFLKSQILLQSINKLTFTDLVFHFHN